MFRDNSKKIIQAGSLFYRAFFPGLSLQSARLSLQINVSWKHKRLITNDNIELIWALI